MKNSIVRRIQLDRPKEASTDILEALEGLSAKEQELLSLRFPWTLEEVGQKWGVTRQRVQAFESKTFQKINEKLTHVARIKYPNSG